MSVRDSIWLFILVLAFSKGSCALLLIVREWPHIFYMVSYSFKILFLFFEMKI